MTYRVDVDDGGTLMDLVVTQHAAIAHTPERVPPPCLPARSLCATRTPRGPSDPARFANASVYFMRLAEARSVSDQALLRYMLEGRCD